MSQILECQDQDGLRVLTLARPEKLNALTPELLSTLRHRLEEAKGAGVRAIVLTGAGRGFCAGQDLAALPEAELGRTDLGRVVEELYNPLILAMRRHPLPIIAAVNGIAAGAGASLALAADIVLAARSARFVQAFVQIGLIPDSGSTWFLPRLVGEARARAAMLLAEPIDAETAAAWGMIWKVCPDETLMEEARALAARLAALSPSAIALIKQALFEGSARDLPGQLAIERDLQREAGYRPDFIEGVRAFREKRPPRFTG
jgi:2-(1,2-epoxy-1,2-dihydrophenyl)acetyl-CoA isomerase